MRRYHKNKFWSIVRAKSKRRKRYSSSNKSHNFLSKNYGGWKDGTKKYRNKGHFDFLKWFKSNKKKKTKPYRDYTFKSSKGRIYTIHSKSSKAKVRKWFATYQRDWGL